MIHPEEKDIGRRVSYKSYRDAEYEHGVIVSFTEHSVMVKYDGMQQPMAAPKNKLEWADQKSRFDPDVFPASKGEHIEPHRGQE